MDNAHLRLASIDSIVDQQTRLIHEWVPNDAIAVEESEVSELETVSQGVLYLVQKVSPQLDAMFAKVESDVLAAFDANSDRVTEAIGREIDRYLAEYKSIVDRQLKEYLDRSARLQGEIRMVNYDLRIIENHKQQLLSASDKITQYIHGYGNK